MAAPNLQDQAYMMRAIQLAERGLYTTSPNPRVGCVIVKDGAVVGEGFHFKAGEGHAEVNALAQAGDQAQGATAYVTLEPCSHFGKTPPCADALIKAGINRLVCAMQDPNPQVAGQGFEKLRQSGIEVTPGVQEQEAQALNPGFIKRMKTGLPLVRIKMAMSLDGRTAMQSGESQWITGPAARQDVQRLRARSCAIVTGVDSILLDDSALTVRESDLGMSDSEWVQHIVARQPLRVVLDTKGRIPASARILTMPGKTIVATASNVTYDVDVSQWVLPTITIGQHERLDLTALLQKLAEQQCNEVLVESGATLAGAFIEQGLVDEIIFYQAATLMGSEARPVFQMPLQKMSEQIRLRIHDTRMVGDDMRITASIRNT